MQQKFHYTTASGLTIIVPRYGDLPIGWARKIRKADTVAEQTEIFFEVIESVLTETELATFDTLRQAEFPAFLHAWIKDIESVAPVGESSASTMNSIDSPTHSSTTVSPSA